MLMEGENKFAFGLMNKQTSMYCKMLVNLLKFYLAEYKNIIYSPDHFFFFLSFLCTTANLRLAKLLIDQFNL